MEYPCCFLYTLSWFKSNTTQSLHRFVRFDSIFVVRFHLCYLVWTGMQELEIKLVFINLLLLIVIFKFTVLDNSDLLDYTRCHWICLWKIHLCCVDIGLHFVFSLLGLSISLLWLLLKRGKGQYLLLYYWKFQKIILRCIIILI